MIWLSSGFNQMAENYLRCYSPATAPFSTLIYGPVGVGKTTLLRACYQRLKGQYSIEYLDAGDFIRNYAIGAKEGTLHLFRQRVRTTSLLILDHLEAFGGKTLSIEEFQHTFEALFAKESKIICSFCGELSQLDFLGEKLSSRLLGGLTLPILPLSHSEILRFLEMDSRTKFLIFEDKVLTRIAAEVDNFPQAQSFLDGFVQYANEQGEALNQQTLTSYLVERKRKERQRISPQNIIEKTGELIGVDPADIYGPFRTARISEARRLAIYAIRTLCRISYPEIGRILNRSHSSIIKSCQQVEKSLGDNQKFKEVLEDLLRYFNYHTY